MANITGDGLKLLQEKQNGDDDLHKRVVHSMHPALLGSGLDKMNRNMIKNLKASIDGLEQDHTSIDLHLWCQHAVALASTDAVYGSHNPYKDPAIENAFW